MKQKLRPAQRAKNILYLLSPVILLIIILLVLQMVATYTDISKYVLPKPTDIIYDTATRFVSDILPHALFTLRIILVGYVIAIPAGMLLAAVFSQFGIVVKAVTPVIIWLVVTPMITLIPLINLWLGTDPNLRVIVVIVQVTPIITLNTLAGFTNLETEKQELAKSVGAGKFFTFAKIRFMNAMPQVFTGLKLGAIFSTIAAISSDFVAGMCGLGFRILQYTKYNLTTLTYGCIIIIALIGIILYMVVELIEKRVVVWKK